MDEQLPVTTEPECVDDVEEHVVRAFTGAPRPVRESGRTRPPRSVGSRRP